MFKKQRISDWGGYLFVMLCVILIMGHSKGMISLFAMFSILSIFKIKTAQINTTSSLLLLFTLFYVFASCLNGAMADLSSMIIYGLPWFIFYNYGRYVANRAKNDRDITLFIILVAFCAGAPVYLSIIQKIITTGNLVDPTRALYLFSNEESVSSSTNTCVGIYIGYIGLTAFLLLKKWKLERWLFLLLFVLSILVPINVVTRFPLVVAAICFIIGVSVRYRKSKFTVLGIFILAAGFIFVLYYQGGIVGQIFEAYADRNSDPDASVATMGSRTIIWSNALSNLFLHPFGWYGTKAYSGYMHNMWLDVASYSGLIPFLLLIILTIKSCVVNYRLLKISDAYISYIFFLLNLSFCLVVFVEPIFGGLTVGLGTMVWGLQEAYLKKLTISSHSSNYSAAGI